uniref:RAS guanyl-releasing protein 1-like n=1 Tax=Styela clava TaxID=7725 RepID=UPI0019392B98|nr:RAS guanyl-releasing protein 1-like [Styela clava]
MGQQNNCLPYKSNSYNIENASLERTFKKEIIMTTNMRRYGRPRLRSVMSDTDPIHEDCVVLSKEFSYVRTQDHIDKSTPPSQLPRRNSLESLLASCGHKKACRRASTQATFEEHPKTIPRSRRGSLPVFPNKQRSFRLLSRFRLNRSRLSFDEIERPQANTEKERRRSSSLGFIVMAHHRLRSGSSGQRSPVSKKISDTKSLSASEDGAPQQNSDYDSSLHQPASVEFLVKKCASYFDENGECGDSEFPRVLFLTHPWFMTSEQLVVLFSQLFEDENTTVEMKRQIFFAIRYWMKEFPHAFDLDAALVEAVKNLQFMTAKNEDVDSSLIDLSNRGNYKWMRTDRLSVRPPQGAGRKRRKVSLVFHHLEPEELAIHMSYLEFKCFRRLTFEDFHKYAIRATIKNNAKLERAVFLFNNITLWVQCMVLGQHTPQERASVITKYIKISQKLREMRNYNTLMAVVGGLRHTAIARLKKTMSALPKDSIKALDELVELLDSKSNYVAYRRDYAQQQEGNTFKIPIIGIHMKDIIGLHTALPDRVGDNLINVKKMLSIGSTFQEMLNLQRSPFPFEVNKDLVNTLRVSLYLYYTEEEIYSLSLQREPRDMKNSVSSANSPSKMNNMVFAEFTRFTCQLDNDTVKQHVTAMVESVFKAYDHDNDGFISEEEFNSFTDNFPMMESFSAMDVDRDGLISRSEMCDYFMKASAVRRNDFCQNFTHEFTESTYFHPTFCEECEKLLWGLVKQGWKCKGCGINCHKHCKDRIVQECRPKQQQHSNNSELPVKRNGRRDKSSVSSESDLSANGDTITILSNTTTISADDEAFDSPGELVSTYQSSPSTMRRSTSLASADVTSRNLLRQIQHSKTPPPVRKSSSADSGGRSGRRSLMQKIIPKLNSHKSRSVIDATTQTPPQSPSRVDVQLTGTVMKSFLYPATSSPRHIVVNGNLPNGRLGSTGEDIDEIPLTHVHQTANNNHAINRVTTHQVNDLTKSTNDLNIKDERKMPSRQYSIEPLNISAIHEVVSPTENTPVNQNPGYSVFARRDSGLSGCSSFTFSDRSFPATPILLSELQTQHGSLHPPLLGKNLSNSATAFKFPSNFVDEENAAKNSLIRDNDAVTPLVQENARLCEANAVLQGQLEEMKNYVKILEDKLKQSGISLSDNDRKELFKKQPTT